VWTLGRKTNNILEARTGGKGSKKKGEPEEKGGKNRLYALGRKIPNGGKRPPSTPREKKDN